MSRSSQRSTIKDMTNGSPAKLILGFAVPMLMGLLFQQFYSMVDTIIVGKFLGVDALAFPFRLHSGSARRITRICAVSSPMPDGSPPVLP